ncbi:TetR/AcrR family transcriptional regulator [Streptomyces sp. NBC_01276]|uniref:TetR/AcrR family transcriptional regulator n=1 Tax=Streptomyces sp. NBC_01276 TaxID=2903808 RepID=UPI002F912CEB
MGDTPSTTATEPQGRRERNKLRVKNRIYEAALVLFTQQGYDQTTVDEITERADVARGTFFNHFQRKEDLIAEWGQERRALLREGLEAGGLTNSEDKATRQVLSRCMTILADISLRNPPQTKAMLTAWVRAGFPLHEHPYAAHMFSEFIRTGRERGDVPQDVDAELAGHMLRDIYLGTLYQWTRGPEDEADLEASLQAACTAVLDGLVPRCASLR